MRIIAGKYGGRKLASFKADHIRPTTDRIKEAMFNKLQADVDGARVLDLFSGTGNLAIESLSRGAESVDAVEMNRKSVMIIKKNKDLLQIGNELQIIPSDVLRFLKKAEQSYDIILIDPPFTKKMAHETMESVSQSSVLHQGTQVFIEASAHEKIEESYPGLELLSRKDYGDKSLLQYQCNRS